MCIQIFDFWKKKQKIKNFYCYFILFFKTKYFNDVFYEHIPVGLEFSIVIEFKCKCKKVFRKFYDNNSCYIIKFESTWRGLIN